jgi:hypothetical protein
MPRPAHPGLNRATSPTSPDAKPSTKLRVVGPATLIVSGVTVPELASHWSVAASATIGAADVHRLPRPPRVGEAPPYLSPPSQNAAIYHQSRAATAPTTAAAAVQRTATPASGIIGPRPRSAMHTGPCLWAGQCALIVWAVVPHGTVHSWAAVGFNPSGLCLFYFLINIQILESSKIYTSLVGSQKIMK